MTWQLTWIDPDSISWDLTGTADRVAGEIVGLGAPEHQHFAQTFPLLAGNMRVGGLDGPRMITLNVTHVASPGSGQYSTTQYQSQLFDDREDLAALFDPTRGESRLQYVLPNGKTWEIRGYAWARPGPDSVGRPIWVQPLTVQFWCPWPYWYDPVAYDAATNTDGVVTATLTLSGTSTVTTSLPYGTAANGFVAGYPHTFTIAGQATNVDIWIGSTASMNFNSTAGYTITSGNTVTIYGPPFNQPRALLNGATRVDGYVDKTDTTWAFQVPLGGGTLSAKGGNAGDDGVVTLAYRQYRRGI